MNNIVLIGMPAAGKSTIGVILAKTMGKLFIDTDLVIQQNEEMLLQQYIDKNGLKKFLQAEESSILGLTFSNSVVATGGSVIYSEAAMRHLKRESVVVYLELSYEEIENRLNNITTRGIAMDKDKSLQQLYKERTPIYSKFADILIKCDGKNVEEIVCEIIEKI